MRPPPESTTDRLYRELWRLRLTPGRPWLGGGLTLGILALLGVLRLPQSEVTHLRGTMIAATPLRTEEGIRLDLRVEVGGAIRPAASRARLLHPDPGATVCLRQERRWPGRVTLALTDIRLCTD